MDFRMLDLVGWTYTFGSFKLFPDRQLLHHAGTPVRLGGRSLEILTALVRHAGDTVSKAELMELVWPDTFVHESNLKVNVATLRRVLAEHDPVSTYIATVTGRGYRFVTPVHVELSMTPSPARITALNLISTLPERQVLIGRTEVIALLTEQLTLSRCVTIVGPGGSGKTTVALAVAHDVKSRYQQGACFIDLSTVSDAHYVVPAIAMALGEQLRAEDMLSGVVAALRDRHLLLVLDNCEHLSSAVATAVGHILVGAAGVSVLATSREPLRTRAEHVYRLPTLAVPDENSAMDATSALRYSAVELFVTRASRRCGYAFTDGDVAAVTAICRRLDGIALAIELAAGKIDGITPAALFQMLEQRFEVLDDGSQNAPLRQQTLLATLDWSYRLLSVQEATILRFLSVFVGYFRMDDALAMAGMAELDATLAIDGLGQLVAKSLLAVEIHDGSPRYRLLETTRDYVAGQLREQGEDIQARRGHAVVILSVLERAEGEWFWRVKRDWMSDYAMRLDDLRHSISWAFGQNGDRALGVRLTAAAIPLWDELSSICEARSRVDYALDEIGRMETCGIGLRMKLATARAWGMTFAQPILPETEAAWIDCLNLASSASSVEYELRGLWGMAVFFMYTGRPHEAIGRLKRFRILAATDAGASAAPDGERLMANAETYVGLLGSAVERLEDLAAKYGTLEDRSRIARFQVDRYVSIHGTLALALWLTGAPTRAARMARQALEGARSIGHVASQSTALALWVLPVAFWSGDYDLAAVYQEALDESNGREEIAIFAPVSRFFHGAIRAARGDAGGIAEMRTALAALVAGGFIGRTPMFRCMIAAALLSAGDVASARDSADEALSTAMAQGERWCLPEILRVRGLIELHLNNPVAGERTLIDGLKEARDIGALSLELRVALTLADKWNAEGRVSEACDLLASIVIGFETNCESVDLAEAYGRLESWDVPLKKSVRG
jgi:predicted ATPase/DNA-binding winged helix-turn-helix (wHTH) protein